MFFVSFDNFDVVNIAQTRAVDVVKVVNLKKIKKLMNIQLKKQLKTALTINDLNQKCEIHRKIDVFEMFCEMKYFEKLKKHANVIVNMICNKIQQIIQIYFIDEFEFHSFVFFFRQFFSNSFSHENRSFSKKSKYSLNRNDFFEH